MAQQVQSLLKKPRDLNVIPGNHVKGERKELIAQSCPLLSAYVPLLHIKLPSMTEDEGDEGWIG